MNYILLIIQTLFIVSHARVIDKDSLKFPNDFKFGVSSSAYQTEGAWNDGGRGESIWDRMIHTKPDIISHSFNADEAIKSYHFIEKDIEILKNLGVDFYRFSISWPRILPNGRTNYVNPIGVNYYNKVIDLLLKNNIEPMVTLYHWDLPQVLEDEGGFLNSSFPLVFEDYARVAFDLFGDRVKKWITFNEPYEICVDGYGGNLRAPLRNFHGYGEYICAANLLTAHARAYHLYNDHYRSKQNGIVGYSVGAQCSINLTNSESDIMAAEQAQNFYIGLFVHPIFSKEGGYPKDVIKRVPKDRLVNFTDPSYLKNASDFLGVNHYDVYYVSRDYHKINVVPSFDNDLNITWVSVRRWSKEWLKIGPSGFGNLLKWLQKNYNNPIIYLTENGIAGGPGLNDVHRVWYYRRYLIEILKAIKNGIRIKGYAPWSLTDNFEWVRGYSERYGLYQVDFNSTDRMRTPRRSASAYKNIVETRTIDIDYMNDMEWEEGPELENLSDYRFKPKFDFRPPSIRGVHRKPDQSDLDYAIDVMTSQIITFNRPFQDEYKFLIDVLDIK